ncbi:hypothetical protein SISSUDRAFT_1040026 [Sistotremastrum suecicum HHB10207 ss-3]|uniref:CCHC-type domain-containing protein n=1 Tax=Sistotremastrum suecicum HHB10207 ss-3 TaxID=1314776 RepID=A0A166IB45_9AGAM|nr:hypothetical protein SISSUDRAFT_1040026 [Sistotremastrum suecicum HHB10207 ss-3]
MTRYTSVGYKRTYLEAGFEETEPIPGQSIAPTASQKAPESETSTAPQKRRKNSQHSTDGAPLGKAGSQRARNYTLASASESRREKRIAERLSSVTCFACREKGHEAKNCPSDIPAAPSGVRNKDGQGGKSICYRCGSDRHTLSKCKKPQLEDNALPFAHCFVCSQTGHLASACAQNASKGIYPNGGSCRLCGETTHLAKDCGKRRIDNSQTLLVGVGQGAGADEDDYHIMKRQTTGLEKKPHRQKPRDTVKSLAGGAVIMKTSSDVSHSRPPVGQTPKVKVVAF